MLDETLKSEFTPRAKEEARKLLCELNIKKITEESLLDLEGELDDRVIALVNQQEDGEKIDEELLKIYDLLTDIVLANEDDLDLLNDLFFN